MSQFDKLLQRIKSLDNDMRFGEVRKVLEAYGYTMSSPGSGSSHRTFRKKARRRSQFRHMNRLNAFI